MQLRGGHLCFNLVTARHNETLGEKIESAHDCKTDKKQLKVWKFLKKSTGFFPLQRFRVDSLAWLSEEHEGMISLVKRYHMMYHVKNYQRCNGEEWREDFDSRKMEQFVCILILICTGKALEFKLII